MGVFWIAFSTLFGLFATKFIGRALLGAGLGLVTYTGTQAVLDNVSNNITSIFTSLPVEVLQAAETLQVDRYIAIVLSAVAFRVAFGAAVRVVRT